VAFTAGFTGTDMPALLEDWNRVDSVDLNVGVWSTLVDSFTRANEDPISSPWVNSVYSADSPLALISNQLKRNGIGWGSAYYNTSYGPDCELVVTFGTVNATDGLELALRIVDGDTGIPDFYMLHISGSTGVWQLWKSVDGTQTQIGSDTANPGTLAAGDKIAFRAVGSRLTGLWKPSASGWQQIITNTDSTFTGAGNAGLLMQNSSWTVDDFTVGTVSDKWVDATIGMASMQIVSNAVRSEGFDASAAWNGLTGSSLWIAVESSTVAGGQDFGGPIAVIKASDTTKGYAVEILPSGTPDSWQLWRDNTTQIGAGFTAFNLTAGDWVGLEVNDTGSQIDVTLWHRPAAGSWTSKGTISDTAAGRQSGPYYPGVKGSGGHATTNFYAQNALDIAVAAELNVLMPRMMIVR
jgi:hypothetical protein